MNTNFFTTFSELLEGQDLSLVIKRKADQLTVIVFPKPRVDDPIKKDFPALNLIGTAEELDQHFFGQITRPLQETSQWAIDTQEWEDKMATMKAASQRAADEKKEAEKLQQKIKDFIKETNTLLEEKNYKAADAKIKKALELDQTNKEAGDLQKKIIQLSSTSGLFNQPS